MATTASEYKEDLLRKLQGDAFLADKDAAFWGVEIQYSETDAIRETLQGFIDQAEALGEFLRAAAAVLEDVETAF